ncbi:MAG TPA: transglycosylase SLT domain-containing protein [Acidobacteriota bacterium]|nr:transglycosylase SLT domain-containing protein [Acidobacteriota bacterium]HQF86497.1 transglycosylase SLT domain-containing protein [Acidobacteriota bacterium]HQG90251.1 transglycosylase SLT domain-containing protein [Acidobacteriota bacterium]HQK86014.1 transglycosylase SLT domain-containing protein [Acidobacteriota bacterium]
MPVRSVGLTATVIHGFTISHPTGGGQSRPRFRIGVSILAALYLLFLPPVIPAASASALFSENGLSDQVDFWEQVFTRWGQNQVLIHDRQDLRLVYEIMQLDGDYLHDPAAAKAQQQAVRSRLEHWEGLLRHAAGRIESGAPPDPATARVLSVVGGRLGRPPAAAELRELAGRLRSQRGIREEFAAGWRRAGRYYPHMQTIFRANGIPEEILAIPFFESSFREDSRSRKGATGVWQFIRSTGRTFLRVNRHLDERLDPLLATYGAVKFLRDAHGKLGSWPLAVMAYNHGTNGIFQARQRLGSDPLTIIRYYSSNQFGFASRNYYSEFLASLRILRQPERYFPNLVQASPWEFREIHLSRSATFAQLQKQYRVPAGVMLDFNPAVIRSRATAKLSFPAGFRLKLPPVEIPGTTVSDDAAPIVATAAPAAPAPATPAGPGPKVHRVQAGETLYRIAMNHKVTVAQLRQWNKLPGNTIRVGQRLVVQP